MAYGATITWSSGTINLNDGTVFTLMEYTPRSNEIGVPDVQDTIRIKVEGTSTGAVGSACGSIEKALRGAQEYQERRAGNRGFLYFAPDGYSGAYHSEILSASRFEIEEPYMFNFSNNKAVFGNIYLNRKNYWEGNQTQFTNLGNPNGTSGTAAVYNSNDGGTAPGDEGPTRWAYADVPGSSIIGDMPGPALLYYTNMAGTAMEKLWVFNQIYQGTAFTSNIDTNKFTLGTIIGTADYVNYSGGSARTYGIGSASMGLFAKATVTPGAAVPEQMTVMVVTTSGATSTLQLRADLVSNNITIQTGMPAQMDGNYHQIIDIFKIPPTNVLGPLEVWLYGQNSAGSSNLVVDNIWTMPLQGGYREYNIIGTTLGTTYATGNQMIDAETLITHPQLYIAASGANYYNVYAIGEILHLTPGVNNRLWFVREDANGRNPGSNGKVQLVYYPRRLKL